MAEFLKVWKLHRNCLKLFTNDQIGLRCWKDLVLNTQHTLYCICRVCKISPIFFQGFLCGIFDAVESHHNASESVETFHTSPNHCLEVKKLSLGQWWCTGQRVLEFTYGSNISSLSFIWLNSWKFENCIGIVWNSSQMTEWVVVAEQT